MADAASTTSSASASVTASTPSMASSPSRPKSNTVQRDLHAQRLKLAESLLPQSILRNIGDRNYDKRKAAAVELEQLVNTLNTAPSAGGSTSSSAERSLSSSTDAESNTLKLADDDKLPHIISLLGETYACSTNSHQRKGGLIGLAGCAIGTKSDAPKYLNLLLPPVLHCFDDPESRVRYYACEAMYNILKVTRKHCLAYFKAIFDGLCKLFADVDVDVKNGANLLNRLVKDIVTESDTEFNVDLFMPLLQKYLKMSNPYIRQLLVGWISALDSVPQIDMLARLPIFLGGLFDMLSDTNREIRQAADSSLAEFLSEIKTAVQVDFAAITEILVPQCRSSQKFNRLTGITWLHDFIGIGGPRLSGLYANFLVAILHCISDSAEEIRGVAESASRGLLNLVHETPGEIDIVGLLDVTAASMDNDNKDTRYASLLWIRMLLDRNPTDMLAHVDMLMPLLLKRLIDTDDEVVLLDLEVLARIAKHETQFAGVLSEILSMFRATRELLDTHGSLVVRKLCVLLPPQKVYVTFAGLLTREADLEFISLVVENLNIILFTAPELGALRKVLKDSWTAKAENGARALFATLYKSWCHSPVSVLSLCLLAQAYDLSSCLVMRFSEIEVTVGFLMGIDKLVQLLESPIFLQLRLHLLGSGGDFRPALLKALYGILMLLPQSAAYTTLRDRLSAASQLQVALNAGGASVSSKDDAKRRAAASASDGSRHVDLLRHFSQVQSVHADARERALKQRSLVEGGNQE